MSARKPGVEPDRTADGLFALAAAINNLAGTITIIFNHIRESIAAEDAAMATKAPAKAAAEDAP